MKNITKSFGIIIGFLLFFLFLSYISLIGASQVYISGGMGNTLIDYPIWDIHKFLLKYDLPLLDSFGPIRVEKVTVNHALRNAFFLGGAAVLISFGPVILFLGGIIMSIVGLTHTDWGGFLAGTLGAILGVPLSIIIGVLILLFAWVSLLFMPCTPGHAFTWLFVGIPFTALGFLIGGGSTAYTTIIIIRR